jgi:hypothetical protein
MKNVFLPFSAAALLFCLVPFSAAAQTSSPLGEHAPLGEREEVIVSGRFGAEEPVPATAAPEPKTYRNQWLFLGARVGPSLRLYTPEGDTAFTGGDTVGWALDAGVQASLQISPRFSVQGEVVFTWDNASVWFYAQDAAPAALDRYTRQFTGFSLQFPLMAKFNFYPGKFRVSPFLGGYFFMPLGEITVRSSRDATRSFSWSLSPPLGVLGGVNVALPLKSGMFFADVRYTTDLGEPDLDGGGDIKTYRRHLLSFSLGYEFGFCPKK